MNYLFLGALAPLFAPGAPPVSGAQAIGQLVTAAVAAPADPRVCRVAPLREDDGSIKRSMSALAAFRKLHACPSTGSKVGTCPRWQVDHVIPLACGGCDTVINMQWLPVQIKTAPGVYAKDRWERTVYCLRRN